MLGRPSFLILTTVIIILSLWIFVYAFFGVDDGIIQLEAATVSTISLLTLVISVLMLLLGILIQAITRPFRSATLVAHEDKGHSVENEDWVYRNGMQLHASGTELMDQ